MAVQDNKDKSNSDTEMNNEIEPTNGEVVEDNVCVEYDQLNNQLDELNTALDVLEQRNDDICDKLRKLLQSNIEIRQELKNEQNKADD